MKSGVYKISNNSSARIYIGSSVNIANRFRAHRSNLVKGVHPNKALQNTCEKYGIESFSFTPILICSKENLLFYEQMMIDHYKSYQKEFGYNLRKDAASNVGMAAHPNQIASVKKMWEDKDFREKMAAANTSRLENNPQFRNEMRERFKRMRQDPVHEEKRKRLAAEACSKRCKGVPLNPEHVAKMKATKIRQYKSGEVVAPSLHGMADSPAHISWMGILRRCNNPTDTRYKNCGAKGIKVCESWSLPKGVGFMNFYKDMGRRPKNSRLCRRDKNGHFEPSNCFWLAMEFKVKTNPEY